MNAMSWHEDAGCRGLPVRVFFGVEGESRHQKATREREAKQVCSWCPVRAECLQWALETPEKYGTWGGLDEDERASERRRRMRRAADARNREQVSA